MVDPRCHADAANVSASSDLNVAGDRSVPVFLLYLTPFNNFDALSEHLGPRQLQNGVTRYVRSRVEPHDERE